jgi:hypothetical protein
MKADRNLKQQLGESNYRKHVVTLLLFLFLLVVLLLSARKRKVFYFCWTVGAGTVLIY